MARFPKSEAEVLALGQSMATGLAANAAVYPSPPVSVADLGAALSAVLTGDRPGIHPLTMHDSSYVDDTRDPGCELPQFQHIPRNKRAWFTGRLIRLIQARLTFSSAVSPALVSR
jgi:hypothetical protein